MICAAALALAGCGAETRPPSEDVSTPHAAAVPSPIDPALQQGFAIYQAHCASCHGANGEGDPDWMISRDDGSLPPPPHDSSGHTWHHSDEELMRIIREGGVIYMPQSGMPGYAEMLTEDQMRASLEYIKSFWGPTERAFQAERSLDSEVSAP